MKPMLNPTVQTLLSVSLFFVRYSDITSPKRKMHAATNDAIRSPLNIMNNIPKNAEPMYPADRTKYAFPPSYLIIPPSRSFTSMRLLSTVPPVNQQASA
eukprot:scaffold6416_cov111-Skeletonema_marinoi.AAC.5